MTVQTPDMDALVHLARTDREAFLAAGRVTCLLAVRNHVAERRAHLRARHEAGESGATTLRLLTDLCDETVRAVFDFALTSVANRGRLESQTALCALGGYGRGEMSPCSDLDVSLIFDCPMDRDIETINTYLLPFFWDLGFKAGYTLNSVSDAATLAAGDTTVFTSYGQSRLIYGDTTAYGRLKMMLAGLEPSKYEALLADVRRREQPDHLPVEYRDLYAPEPNIKENSGGLRDYHAGLWMLLLTHGPMSLDELATLGHISAEEHLELLAGLNFIWRIRHELHFHTGRGEDRLTFSLQEHVARAFGYGDSPRALARFMEDYYHAACRAHQFLQIAARIADQPSATQATGGFPQESKFLLHQQQLCVDPSDKNWFAENPPRLMEVIWECARRKAPLSGATAHWLSSNLSLVNEEFRKNDFVRQYFMAIARCPLQAGLALREAARTGLLAAYLPEFKAISGIVRYEDFHSYPVDEHTLRALEALEKLCGASVAFAPALIQVLERVSDPHVLVLAILFHDLGKACGEKHVEDSVRLADAINGRIGVDPYDAERILLLVRHHMLMSNIALYRDTDDLDVITSFAKTVKTDDLLRMLLLLTYADLMAVAPNVWNEWKGALLLKLFLKTQRILTGRSEHAFDEALIQPKLDSVRILAEAEQMRDVDGYLNGLSERYILGYAPEQIVTHMKCLAEARTSGIAVACTEQSDLNASEVVICTQDRHGLFAEIAGVFSSQLINVRNAALFTRDDGWVVDSFLVEQAAQVRPLTGNEVEAFKRILVRVILEREDIRSLVDKSRRRLFALTRSSAMVRTSVTFDNDSSPRDTVIDIVAGDRTGLLYDIAYTLSEMGIDFRAAHIVTDVGRARDAFYVRMNGSKLEEERLKEWISRRLCEAIAGAAIPATPKGDSQ
ncbi:MAG: [protein-PII] uridylyltransferase [Candidatus Hydrogenedentes bacterium]|nr:[protein-PII] uridylyltransferase [Candidatus Hydrogenedentota bacterium]